MRPRLLAGLFAVALLALPAGLQAQHGGMMGGGRAAAPSGGMSFAGGAATHSGNIRSISSVPVANGSSVARSHSGNPFSVYGVQAPARLSGIAGNPSLGIRSPRGSTVAGGNIGNGNHHPRRPPRGGNPSFYFLTGGGYWYAGPGSVDDSDGQPQDAANQEGIEGQQADDQQQQPADNGQYGGQYNDQREARNEMSAEPAPEPQEAAPLPDVGSFTLVMRDGRQVDALAFTRSQDKIIYITPDGGRRTVALGDIDSDSTERVNQDRGTPLQFPL